MRVPRFAFLALGVITASLAACSTDDSVGPEASALRRSASSGEATQYLVLGKKNALPSNLEAQVASAGGRVVSVIPQIGVAVIEGGADFANAAGRFGWAESVAPDLVVEWLQQPQGASDLVVEADVGAESHAFDPAVESFYGYQWAPAAIDAPQAWAAGYRGAGARVAVLDGGIHGAHVDLRDRIDVARSTSFTTGAWNTDVGTFWHGTHVAGIVAASANGIGTIGIAPEATIIGVKVLHNGTGPFSSILNGIVYAAKPIAQGGAGAHVINMSLGATLDEKRHDMKRAVRELKKAVDRATTYAYQNGVIVIASSGNSAINFDVLSDSLKIPAQNAHVVAISATGPHGWALGQTDFSRLAYYSDFGKALVSLSGPGGNAGLLVVDGNASLCTKVSTTVSITNPCYVFDYVMSSSRGATTSISSYSWSQGTSMASPAVAGVAALIIGKNGGPMHPSQVLARLQQSSSDLGKPGFDEQYGQGWVNAWRAVR